MSVTSVVEHPAPYNLAAYFVDRHIAEGRGESPAVRCDGHTWTYREVYEAVNRAGHLLRNLGVQEEQRVMIVLPDSLEFVVAFFATVKIGAVAVPTNTALQPEEYARCLDDSRARLLVVVAELLPRIAPILEGRRFLRHVVVVGRDSGGYANWDERLARESPSLDPALTSGDEAAFWLWTSGSTGHPKAAVHLHQDWMHCCEGYARGVLDIGPRDVTYSPSKLFHAYGLGNALMFPFYVGATTVLYPGKAIPEVVLATVERERPSLFFSVPTLYAAMLQQVTGKQAKSPDFSSVRTAVSAAEPLAAEIFTAWATHFGIEILDGLGSTEVLHIYLSARAGRAKAGSVGQPVPGYEIRLADGNGNQVADGELGDLSVRGQSTALSYWNRRSATVERMQGEWFATGDKAYRDADGYFWYAGRSDDMFRVSGEWVSPLEVERALAAHDSVLDAAVVSFEDTNHVTKPMAFIVLKPGAAIRGDDLTQTLQEFVRERVTHYKCPRRIVFVEQLPKTPAGKIQRFKLRAEHREQ